jgi:hypothetical protein
LGHEEGSQALLVIAGMPSLESTQFHVRLAVDDPQWPPLPATPVVESHGLDRLHQKRRRAFFVTSLSIYIVASISRSNPPATMVNSYDVKTPIGHEDGSQALLVILENVSLELPQLDAQRVVA